MFLADASMLTLRRLPSSRLVSPSAGILARGPWQTDQVAARWRADSFAPDPAQEVAADAAIAALADRGSPAHDGLAARLAGWRHADGGLELELQPMRWALRLLADGASDALSVLCVVRDADGRWLAGRRAAWVASWAGRWALGAGGAVEVGENPVTTLSRELEEEWSVRPERLSVEALVRAPSGMMMLVGQAWLGADPQVTRDPEHDAHAWWPADVDAWPDDADPVLCTMARLLDSSPPAP
jgi:8-oxo-dGTP diphosphatase